MTTAAEMRTKAEASSMGHHPRFLYWTVTAIWLLLFIGGIFLTGSEISTRAPELVWWVLALGVIDLLPVKHGRALFTADLALLTAAALVLPPLSAGLTAFAGSMDRGEFSRTATLSRMLYNRSQAGLSTLCASLVTHTVFQSHPGSEAALLPLAFVALSVVAGVNYLLVGPAFAALHGCSLFQAIRRMRVGSGGDYLLTSIVCGLSAGTVAILYDRLQALALLVFIGPTILTRQTLVRSQMYIESDQALRVRDLAVAEMARQSLAERADERRLVAADLHDEILQPLYKVTLMTHVLKTELAQGRLLDMEVDLPELLEAAEVASTSARSLIGELRESTLGRGGLAPSLTKLIQLMSASARAKVEAGICRVEADGATELALYQIAKEALSNALTHARATKVAVELAQSEGVIALTVRDDGIGFDPRIEREGHFGLHIMRERASAAGAELFLDSALGGGTQITALVSRTSGEAP